MPDRPAPARHAAPPGARTRFSRAERRRLIALYGVVAALHLLGWGLFLHESNDYPALVGMGLAAYLFGLRHAFDVDHIAAVDDTVRYLMRRGERPLGVGFFFALGHATVVFLLALTLVMAAGFVKHDLPELQQIGALIGAGVSGVFLWLIGALNLILLADMLELWHRARTGSSTHASCDALLRRRGLLNRLLGARAQTLVAHSWQMYPIGLLFGLGFDTASEVALLAMTAGAAAGDLRPAAVLALPLLFAAGMTAIDTTDGVLMTKAYEWALVNPLRRIFYSLATTGLSVGIALLVGTVELARVAIHLLSLRGGVAGYIATLDLGALGYVVAGMFALAWAGSFAVWKLGRFERA